MCARNAACQQRNAPAANSVALCLSRRAGRALLDHLVRLKTTGARKQLPGVTVLLRLGLYQVCRPCAPLGATKPVLMHQSPPTGSAGKPRGQLRRGRRERLSRQALWPHTPRRIHQRSACPSAPLMHPVALLQHSLSRLGLINAAPTPPHLHHGFEPPPPPPFSAVRSLLFAALSAAPRVGAARVRGRARRDGRAPRGAAGLETSRGLVAPRVAGEAMAQAARTGGDAGAARVEQPPAAGPRAHEPAADQRGGALREVAPQPYPGCCAHRLAASVALVSEDASSLLCCFCDDCQ